MTLDEAIRHVRIIADNCKGIDSSALTLLIDHAEAGQALRDVYYRPNADVMRRLAERLQAGNVWLAERLRDFDWGQGLPPRPDPDMALLGQFAAAALGGILANDVGPQMDPATIAREACHLAAATVAELRNRSPK